MKLAYEFSQHEIRTHDITHFQSLFGMERIKAAIVADCTLHLNMIGSMRISYELNDGCTQPHENPDIRILCGKLVSESPALLWASTSGLTMALLFYSTLMISMEVSVEKEPDRLRFAFDTRQTRKHAARFQELILGVADMLEVPKLYSMPHCAQMKAKFY